MSRTTLAGLPLSEEQIATLCGLTCSIVIGLAMGVFVPSALNYARFALRHDLRPSVLRATVYAHAEKIFPSFFFHTTECLRSKRQTTGVLERDDINEIIRSFEYFYRMFVVPFILLNSMSSSVVDKFNWFPAARDQSSAMSSALVITSETSTP